MLHTGAKLGCKYLSISKGVQENELLLNNIDSVLINNWINTEHFKPANNTETIAKKTLRLISVGTCSHVKQHCTILTLVALLKEKNYAVEYYHVGAGELEELEIKMAQELKIVANVQFVGNQRNVLPWLYKADFFLMPSLYEGLGNSCAEAMSVGLIPIVNDVPGLRDLVENDKHGLVVDFKNLAIIADKVIELSMNSEKMKVFSTNSREKINQNYSLLNVNKLIAEY
ncbi:GDP-mannose-dependent alpha-(1-6)-phosphatidylinositol monomannoside mannosyltransferase [compost metagenome]